MIYWNDRAKKEKDPDKKAKYEERADEFANKADFHRDQANGHEKVGSGETRKADIDEDGFLNPKDDEDEDDDEDNEDGEDDDNNLPPPKPGTERLHIPLKNLPLHKRVNKAWHHLVNMNIDDKNKIIAEASSALTDEEKEILNEAIKQAHHNNRLTKRVAKVLGKVLLAAIVTAGLLYLGHGSNMQGVTALMAMHYINEHHNNQGLGKIAYKWFLGRPIDDESDEHRDELERGVVKVIEELRNQLKLAKKHLVEPPKNASPDSPEYQEYLNYNKMRNQIEEVIRGLQEAEDYYEDHDKIDTESTDAFMRYSGHDYRRKRKPTRKKH